MKDHDVRELVNALVLVAKIYGAHQSARDRISRVVRRFLCDSGWLSPYDRAGGDAHWPDALER